MPPFSQIVHATTMLECFLKLECFLNVQLIGKWVHPTEALRACAKTVNIVLGMKSTQIPYQWAERQTDVPMAFMNAILFASNISIM